MADNVFMQYEHEQGFVARWHGGEYIELGYLDTEDLRRGSGETPPFIAQEVINVWDYAKGEARIPRTLDERLAEEDDDGDD
jgi:hypothetical protein